MTEKQERDRVFWLSMVCALGALAACEARAFVAVVPLLGFAILMAMLHVYTVMQKGYDDDDK